MNFKKDFPIFKKNKKLIYLDSASTSQKPKKVIAAIKDFYEISNANISRGIYDLSENSTKKYENARKNIAEFINADSKEIIFTKNATESLNLLAYTLKDLIPKEKDEVVLTEMEHHSNLIPWQQFCKKNKFKLKFIPITKNYELDYSEAKKIITNKTAILAFTHISNVLGTTNNANLLVSLAKKKNALTIIDAAQSISHLKVDVKKIKCDFLAFSGHKMLGPAGIGILYGKKEFLENMLPFQFGGGMIDSADYRDSSWAEIPKKFEAGTPNIEGAIGLSEAVRYIKKIGIKNVEKYEKNLIKYALTKLKKIKKIKIYSSRNPLSAISFNFEGVHPHDIASILNEKNIAIRAGHHCCMPLMLKLKIPGTCRISFGIYNNKEDINELIKGLKKVEEVFKIK